MNIFNQRLFTSFIMQVLGLFSAMVGFFITYSYFEIISGLVLGGIIYLILIAVYLLSIKKNTPKDKMIMCLVCGIAIGMIIGSYFTKFNLDFRFLLVLTYGLIVIIISHLLLFLIPFKRTVLCVECMILVILMIMMFVEGTVKAQGMAFGIIFLLFLLMGFGGYVFTGSDFYKYLVLGYMIAFFVIFLVIIIILSEGEALSGIEGVGDIGFGSGRKKINYT